MRGREIRQGLEAESSPVPALPEEKEKTVMSFRAWNLKRRVDSILYPMFREKYLQAAGEDRNRIDKQVPGSGIPFQKLPDPVWQALLNNASVVDRDGNPMVSMVVLTAPSGGVRLPDPSKPEEGFTWEETDIFEILSREKQITDVVGSLGSTESARSLLRRLKQDPSCGNRLKRISRCIRKKGQKLTVTYSDEVWEVISRFREFSELLQLCKPRNSLESTWKDPVRIRGILEKWNSLRVKEGLGVLDEDLFSRLCEKLGLSPETVRPGIPAEEEFDRDLLL